MKTCLVVDDAPFDRAMMKLSAEKLGFTALEAGEGAAALNLCRTSLPHCILLDWSMGSTTGITIMREIRALDGGDGICILICTSNQHPSFIGHAMVNGANGYLIKPITTESLYKKLQELQFLL